MVKKFASNLYLINFFKDVPHKLLHKATTLTFNQYMGQSCPIKCKEHAFYVKGKPLFCNPHLTFRKQIFKYQFIVLQSKLSSKAKLLLPLWALVACSRVTFTFTFNSLPTYPGHVKLLSRNTQRPHRYNLRLLDFVHHVTDILTLKHYISEVGYASIIRQEALILLEPLDKAILSHWVPMNHKCR